ncbi:dihydroorotase [Candidatus Pantoea edessiphila]|uniref:Dihydroorotase n=1 Tax=Candidatus Pantoea edessiphila TaxID=2044610 RepID=A0A2P5T2G2_9GAMM|nr:dihydroorotase [Candidatus Pantoea edessiphila]PPI88767.1 dihydroorotase [Candidatus Pantoea edessiphila]
MIIGLNKITIRRPDDWHLHVRNDYLLKLVLPYTSSIFGRAMIMPNLLPPITNIKSAINYRNKILSLLPKNHKFIPLMTCYLTESSNPNEIELGFNTGVFAAVKLYPQSSTTNSSYGIKNITSVNKVLERLQKIGMPLLIHCEITDINVDIFDREAYFIEKIMQPLRKRFPELKIVMEHISTKEAVEYVNSSDNKIAATITPHHLMLNRNDLLTNYINPHFYCFPIIKSKLHQQALREAVSKGNPNFFLGTDSAPHFRCTKENKCGHAGIFNAPTALLAYATVFEELNAIKYFESFCSENGARFYDLSLNKEKITLIRKRCEIKKTINLFPYDLVPFLAGKTLNWSIKD